MKETTLPISEFKTKCLRLLDDLGSNGGSLLVTKRGRPLARVTPVSPPGKAMRGSWKGILRLKGDVVHFDSGELWESNR